MSERRKLIEVALPLEAINREAAREKSIRHGHPSTLHLWWARRPLAACRAVLFASLIDDPDEPNAPQEYLDALSKLPGRGNRREKLFRFIEQLVKWDNSNDEKIIGTARKLILASTEGNPPPVLDPFCGGGSIPLEAQRLGLKAYASDLNPVAVLITKALIEIPPKFAGMPPVHPDGNGPGGVQKLKDTEEQDWSGAKGLAEDVRYYGQWMRDEAEQRIGHLYPRGPKGETVIAWLWARTVKCPNPACGAQMPLVRSFALSTKEGQEVHVEPKVDLKRKTLRFEVKKGMPRGRAGTVENRAVHCVFCDHAAPLKVVRDAVTATSPPALGVVPLAMVVDGGAGRTYLPVGTELPEVERPDWLDAFSLPEKLTGGAVMAWGFTSFGELFTPRQLVALTTFSDLVGEARDRVHRHAVAAGLPDDGIGLEAGGAGAQAYADAVATYLAFAVDKMTTTNSSVCSWQTQPTRLVAAFARQAIPMIWDYAEANPFSGAAGDYRLGIGALTEVLDRLVPGGTASVLQQDAAASPAGQATSLVSTDPPYYDNIGYADLSDYFYVWLRRALREVYPALCSTVLVPKKQEMVATAHRHSGSQAQAKTFFEGALAGAFAHMRTAQAPGYPLTLFYAFKQSESDAGDDPNDRVIASTGWETMLHALVSCGFAVVGTWPMRTELTVALKASTGSLASSIVLVCRPRAESAPLATRREFTVALRRELPQALEQLTLGGIAPVDLAQASIGPGMAAFSRHSKVLEADGSTMTVRTALQIINQELDAYLASQDVDLDQESRFCVDWFDQYGMSGAEFGQADVLARAKNTAVDAVVQAGVLEARRGKVRLLRRDELAEDWDPATDRRLTNWECTQHLIRALENGGEDAAARLVARLGSGLSETARGLAYRLYLICDRNNLADQALAYNNLIVSWPAIQDRAARVGPSEQGRLF